MAENDLSAAAQVAMLILAANGGEMDAEDHRREFERVLSMSREDFIRWYDAAKQLAAENAIKYFEGRLDP